MTRDESVLDVQEQALFRVLLKREIKRRGGIIHAEVRYTIKELIELLNKQERAEGLR